MARHSDGVAESSAKYHAAINDEHDYRFAEHEHERNPKQRGEPSRPAEQPHLRSSLLIG
jgi:hypothetical protein